MKQKSKNQERRQLLRELSAPIAVMKKNGVITSINDGLKKLYANEGHNELKTLKQWNSEGKKVIKGEKALLLWGRPKKYQVDNADTMEDDEMNFYPLCYVFSENQVQDKEEKTYLVGATRLKLVREGSRLERVKITASKHAEEYCRLLFDEDLTIYESVHILLLDRSNCVDSFVKISQGGVSGTVVDVRLIAKYALDTLASGVIMVHNHPSGNAEPSPQDTSMTKKTKKALGLLDIALLDHIILTEDNYYSFADKGLM